MYCFKCGKEIDDNAKFCGFCGAVMEPQNNVSEKFEEAETQVLQETANFEENVYEQQIQVPENDNKGKKGKKFKSVIVIAAVLVIVVLGGFLLRHPLMQLVLPADNYLRHVEKNNLQNLSSNIGKILTQYNDQLSDDADIKANTELGVEVGKEGQKLLNKYVDEDIDISGIEKISVSYDIQKVKSKLSLDLAAALNDKDIVSGTAYVDDKYLYFCVPDLSKETFKINISESVEELEISVEEAKEILDKIPDGKVIEKILNRYFELVLEQIEDVEKEKDTIEADGISQKATLYTAEINGEVVYNALKTVLKEVKGDEEIKDIIIDFSDKKTYKSFKNGIDELLDDLDKDMFEDMPKFEYKVWVSSNGRVVGRGIEVDDVKIQYITPVKGSKMGAEFSVSQGRDEMYSLSGSGKIVKGKLNGDFILSVKKEKILNFKLQNCTLKFSEKKENTCKITISAAKKLIELIEEEDAPEEIVDIIKNASLVIEGKTSKNSSTLKYSWLNNDKLVVSVYLNNSISNGAKVSIPKDAIDVDDEDIEDYIDEDSLSNYGEDLLEKIYDAGLSEELLEGIVDLFKEMYEEDDYYDDEYYYDDDEYYYEDDEYYYEDDEYYYEDDEYYYEDDEYYDEYSYEYEYY